jgi:hypothetical protein
MNDIASAKVSLFNRSAITNGKKWLPGVDMRSAQGRRFKDLVRAFTADLGGELSTAEAALVRQAAALTVRVEDIQATLVKGEAVDDEELVRLINASARLLIALGMKGRKRVHKRDDDLSEFLP